MQSDAVCNPGKSLREETELRPPQVQGWARPRASSAIPGEVVQASGAQAHLSGRRHVTGPGRRRVPGKHEGKNGPVGPTVRPRLAGKENHRVSYQPGIPTGPRPQARVQPASPLLGLQGLLLAPGLVPRGRGVEVSHGRGRHLCHGLFGSRLLVRGPSLRFPPFGPSVLEPNLSP